MVEIKSLSVIKSGKIIVSDVSFKIEKGKHTVLLGKNGSGKTTVLNCVNGNSDYLGEILTDGVDLKKIPHRERGKRIGFMPQLLASPHITVGELVQMGRCPHIPLGKRPDENDRRKVSEAITLAALSDLEDSYLDRISGGELQRAYLGMVLAQDTELVILDEPTSHMDVGAGEEFLSLADRLVSECGKTLLTVIHDLNSAVRHGDKVAILDKGRLCFFGTKEECLDLGVIERVFGVKRYESEGRVFFGA